MKSKSETIVIIGAGPSGLGAAYELTKNKRNNNLKIIVLDKNDLVGGLARTHSKNGYRFDVGPHRFFTKNREVLNLWKEILGKDFIKVSRLTRMYYKGIFFLYPIEFSDIIKKFGLKDLIESAFSYFYAKVFYRNLEPNTFEEWITKYFGKKLYTVFFKSYTEKLWGVPCSEIGAEWAAQRIKNANFTEVIKNALLKNDKPKAKSWVDKFYYPIKGAGYMYETLAKKLKRKGVIIKLNSKVIKVNHRNNRIISVQYMEGKKKKTIKADAVFSSMPITHLVQSFFPSPPKQVLHASRKLTFRDHITVNFMVKGTSAFPDNWIYIHDPGYFMTRVANFSNFTPKMAKDKKHMAIAVEYFAFQTDKLWQKTDNELIDLAKSELERSKLLDEGQIEDGFVVRETESYPTYYLKQKKYFETIKSYLNDFRNLYLIGRGGMFKYNNMDHAIYTGMLAARNFLAGKNKYNVWSVNIDAEYLEDGSSDS
ncbi:hypothetical protein A2801_00720 [Candidatus Woesebacteria bacterium RIFCSPHIGHO2_01_FULL_41_10]|uniref:Amine oxidase domain-containing protein n=1 Tax=Candidatus Woesebacteria bacterium RIFCSPHIGHO2_01_FULL_41_10 TaxID=1802500 RepID=A0A1F7YQ55_9BACT|nr:MAG: hypothetical protein A2801_00720 [Candidatus Woesebacteria bacterium RIFCSPHIGHO2_01_FULL_41_10]